MSDEEEQKPDEIKVKLSFRIPSRMPSVYAHHMSIQPGENEVLLSFFEVIPPVIPPTMTEQTTRERLRILQETGIVAECVARVTIAKDAFARFAQAMGQVAGQITTPQEASEAREADHANSTRDNAES